MKAVWLLLACAIASLANAQSQSNSDADLCRTTTNPDLAIKHCSAAIDSNKTAGEILAPLYVLRGAAWGAKGDYDRAIADHTTALKTDAKVRLANYYRGMAWSNKGESERAIYDFDFAQKIRPDDPVVYHARAIELAIKGDYARAVADFDKALQLDAQSSSAHFARGRTLFYMSEFTRAATDIEAAFKAQPNIYTALWLYLARRRGGNEDADDLLERETRRIRAGWPAPVIALFMGRTDAASVAASATDTDAVRRRELKCEADFYIAQSHIIKGEPARAQTLLQNVQRDCPKNLLEYEATAAELRRLKK